jgi:hypothetical protein
MITRLNTFDVIAKGIINIGMLRIKVVNKQWIYLSTIIFLSG